MVKIDINTLYGVKSDGTAKRISMFPPTYAQRAAARDAKRQAEREKSEAEALEKERALVKFTAKSRPTSCGHACSLHKAIDLEPKPQKEEKLDAEEEQKEAKKSKQQQQQQQQQRQSEPRGKQQKKNTKKDEDTDNDVESGDEVVAKKGKPKQEQNNAQKQGRGNQKTRDKPNDKSSTLFSNLWAPEVPPWSATPGLSYDESRWTETRRALEFAWRAQQEATDAARKADHEAAERWTREQMSALKDGTIRWLKERDAQRHGNNASGFYVQNTPINLPTAPGVAPLQSQSTVQGQGQSPNMLLGPSRQIPGMPNIPSNMYANRGRRLASVAIHEDGKLFTTDGELIEVVPKHEWESFSRVPLGDNRGNAEAFHVRQNGEIGLPKSHSSGFEPAVCNGVAAQATTSMNQNLPNYTPWKRTYEPKSHQQPASIHDQLPQAQNHARQQPQHHASAPPHPPPDQRYYGQPTHYPAAQPDKYVHVSGQPNQHHATLPQSSNRNFMVTTSINQNNNPNTAEHAFSNGRDDMINRGHTDANRNWQDSVLGGNDGGWTRPLHHNNASAPINNNPANYTNRGGNWSGKQAGWDTGNWNVESSSHNGFGSGENNGQWGVDKQHNTWMSHDQAEGNIWTGFNDNSGHDPNGPTGTSQEWNGSRNGDNPWTVGGGQHYPNQWAADQVQGSQVGNTLDRSNSRGVNNDQYMYSLNDSPNQPGSFQSLRSQTPFRNQAEPVPVW